METYEAKSILQAHRVALGSVFGWDRMTPADEGLMQRIAQRAGDDATQETVADAIAQETGCPAAVVQLGDRVWVRGNHPDDEGLNPGERGTILYRAG